MELLSDFRQTISTGCPGLFAEVAFFGLPGGSRFFSGETKNSTGYDTLTAALKHKKMQGDYLP
ncbi:hypothetical protein [Bilophila wadsworthia]|uniref:hypothetical protein n=1 Tax=Bilophila wadsworthia TaxID=35833 RepID=UPI0026754EA1|nr:hypothetical protein [Bilophila wadsworthia]